MKNEVCNVVSETPTMKEFDCLEMVKSNRDYYDYHEDLYYKILWEKRYGWKHYYHKEIWREIDEWECVGESDLVECDSSWEYIRTDVFEVLSFELGKYVVDTFYYYESRYGLWLMSENGREYCWDFDNIKKVPGIQLNRDLILKELGI